MTTTELFTREGTLHTGPVCTDDKGPYFTEQRLCNRCGGAGGAQKWEHTGWTCFDCGGSGKGRQAAGRLYTAEKLATLNTTRDKRRATQEAKRAAAAAAKQAEAETRREAFEATHGALLAAAEPYLERSPFIADVVRRAHWACEISEKQAAAIAETIAKIAAEDARKASSRHVGEPGERLTVDVTVSRTAYFDRQAYMSQRMERVWIITMTTDDGATLVSKGRFCAEKGDRLRVRATVRDHTTYRDEAQTNVQRVSVVEEPQTAS